MKYLIIAFPAIALSACLFPLSPGPSFIESGAYVGTQENGGNKILLHLSSSGLSYGVANLGKIDEFVFVGSPRVGEEPLPKTGVTLIHPTGSNNAGYLQLSGHQGNIAINVSVAGTDNIYTTGGNPAPIAAISVKNNSTCEVSISGRKSSCALNFSRTGLEVELSDECRLVGTLNNGSGEVTVTSSMQSCPAFLNEFSGKGGIYYHGIGVRFSGIATNADSTKYIVITSDFY